MIKKKNLKLIALILILFISIGFAYLTSNLVINGLIGYKANSWNIYFDNVSMIINDVNGSKPTINNDKDTVEFNVTFSEPGESFKFSVDVVNDGTIDAMLSEILKTGINSSNSSYIDYTVKYSDDTELSINDGIRAGSKTRLNVEVTYKYDTDELAPAGNQNFSIKLTYVQAGDNANFKNSLIKPDNNNVFTLNNAKSNSLSNFKISGNSNQKIYSGKNLYNVYDFKTGTGTVDSDGWITISYNNSGGSGHIYAFYCTHDLDLIPSHEYSIVVEIKSVSGSGAFRPFSSYNNTGQFSGPSVFFSNLTNDSTFVYTVTSRSEVIEDQGLRTHVDFSAGDSGSITFRLSVIDSTDITSANFVYEPYVGGEPAPNPDYPQEVNNVTGSSTFKITGKNMFDGNLELGSISKNTGLSSTSNNSVRMVNYISVKPNTTYVVSNDMNYHNLVYEYDAEKNYIPDSEKAGVTTYRFTTGANTYFVRVRSRTADYENDLSVKFQFEEGDTATAYEPYQEHVYSISLGNIELNKIGNYRDSIYYEDGDWYLEKKIGKYIITGSETLAWEESIPRIYFSFASTISNNDIYPPNSATMPLIMCNKYRIATIDGLYGNGSNSRVNNSVTLSQNNYVSFRRTIWTDINSAKSDITGTKLYYVYRNPIKEKITDSTLLSQLNAIKNSNLFDGVNHVYFDSSIDTDISFDYIEE